MIVKSCQKKKKISNKGLKVLCDCLKCQRTPLSRNLVSISTCIHHHKKYPQGEKTQLSSDEQGMSIVEQELSDNEQELSDNEQIFNDQMLSNTEIIDLESLTNCELYSWEASENTSDNELLTDSNSVSNSKSNEDYHTTIQLPPGFSEAYRLLEIKVHSNMTNETFRKIMDAFSEQNISLYRATKKLSSLVSIDPIWVDCCVKSCCAFTSNLKDLQECPVCREERWNQMQNGSKNEDFILHCSVVSWLEETPALAKLMCTTGHNSYQGCRYCNICGIWENHVYFPTRPLKNKQGVVYDPSNLPKRTHQDYLNKIRE
ncbi:87_t:CDS:2 [Cetraspora pellucida]|uniref:87_t:CDS:1 n=1 Tax=Cetraspora pellucida TaxID=1433469 RepID=A0A9N9BDE3_9GLOM|nr:87_t:CDS:2 [Cetraspora pellucida]